MTGEDLINAAALQSSTPTLDVERLARALMVVTRRQVFPGDNGYQSWLRKTAEAIAREYAALEGAPHDPERMKS